MSGLERSLFSYVWIVTELVYLCLDSNGAYLVMSGLERSLFTYVWILTELV